MSCICWTNTRIVQKAKLYFTKLQSLCNRRNNQAVSVFLLSSTLL